MKKIQSKTSQEIVVSIEHQSLVSLSQERSLVNLKQEMEVKDLYLKNHLKIN